MTEHEASRTLVKSPPELWAELSDPTSLAGHLAEPFGEIRITRVEPETTVAWEGERASGTVRIEPSGWGTRVTLTARAAEVPTPARESPAAAKRPAAPEPPAAAERPARAEGPAEPEPGRGLLSRLLGWFGVKRTPTPDSPPPRETETPPAIETEAEVDPTPPPAPALAKATLAPAIDPGVVLVGVLDRLGAAHHRPFSRP